MVRVQTLCVVGILFFSRTCLAQNPSPAKQPTIAAAKKPAPNPRSIGNDYTVRQDLRLIRYEAMRKRVARMRSEELTPLQALAADNKPDAMFMLGYFYATHDQSSDAESWWNEALPSKNVYALHAMGTMLGSLSPSVKRRYLEAAARADFPPSEYELGKMLVASGDTTGATTLIVKAAKGGWPEAQLVVARCLMKKSCQLSGISPQKGQAERLLAPLSVQGNQDAQDLLAEVAPSNQPASGNKTMNLSNTNAVLQALTPLGPEDRVQFLKRLIASDPTSPNLSSAREEIIWTVEGKGEKPTLAMLKGQDPEDLTVLYFELKTNLEQVWSSDHKSIQVTVAAENAANAASQIATTILKNIASNASLGIAEPQVVHARKKALRENAEFAVSLYPVLARQRRYRAPQNAKEVMLNYVERLGFADYSAVYVASQMLQSVYLKRHEIIANSDPELGQETSVTEEAYDRSNGYKMTISHFNNYPSLIYHQDSDGCNLYSVVGHKGKYEEKRESTGGCTAGLPIILPFAEEAVGPIQATKYGNMPVWRVKMKPGSLVDAYEFDASTYLLVRAERERDETIYGDYRTAGGILFPMKLKKVVHQNDGNTSTELTSYDVLEINQPIDKAKLVLDQSEVAAIKKGRIVQRAQVGTTSLGRQGTWFSVMAGAASLSGSDLGQNLVQSATEMQKQMEALTQQNMKMIEQESQERNQEARIEISKNLTLVGEKVDSKSGKKTGLRAPAQPSAEEIHGTSGINGCVAPDSWQEGEFEISHSGNLDLFIRSYLIVMSVDESGKYSPSSSTLQIGNSGEKSTATVAIGAKSYELRAGSKQSVTATGFPANAKVRFCGSLL